MSETLAAVPFLVLIVLAIGFAFAVIMQPIFVWMICARIKATNASLKRIESLLARPNHNALPQNPIQRLR
jgi:hypothetical protein